MEEATIVAGSDTIVRSSAMFVLPSCLVWRKSLLMEMFNCVEYGLEQVLELIF